MHWIRKWAEILMFLVKPAPVAAREATYGSRFYPRDVHAPSDSEF